MGGEFTYQPKWDPIDNHSQALGRNPHLRIQGRVAALAADADLRPRGGGDLPGVLSCAFFVYLFFAFSPPRQARACEWTRRKGGKNRLVSNRDPQKLAGRDRCREWQKRTFWMNRKGIPFKATIGDWFFQGRWGHSNSFPIESSARGPHPGVPSGPISCSTFGELPKRRRGGGGLCSSAMACPPRLPSAVSSEMTRSDCSQVRNRWGSDSMCQVKTKNHEAHCPFDPPREVTTGVA